MSTPRVYVLDADMRALETPPALDLGAPAPPSPTTGAPAVRVLRKAEPRPPGVPRYHSHFASCPAADRFRRGR